MAVVLWDVDYSSRAIRSDLFANGVFNNLQTYTFFP